jgi:superfamily II DNA/RNA helicase
MPFRIQRSGPVAIQKRDSLTSFNDFGLAEPILRALREEKYETPTPIQGQTIPLAMQARDVIGIAQTGTGKTAAFALPIINHLSTKRLRPAQKSCRVLVLSPTRELSGQIADSFRAYGRYSRPLEIALAIGGVSIVPQKRSLARGVEVLVATPGRLLDLVNQRALRLDQVEVLVLDEADRMLDMGFIPDIRRIVAMLPTERQTLFFSATMPGEIAKLSAQMLRNPARVAVTPQATTAEKVEQRVILTEKASKPALLAELLKTEPVDRVLVFTRTKHGADKVVRSLQKAGLSADAIHGNKSQGQRERALAAFRSGRVRTLIATDIAARGIDVDGVSHVVNYDLPNIPESYVHRIGRTARAGAAGIAISFCDYDEAPFLRDIERLIRMSIPATDRRTGTRPAHRPAAQHAAGRHNGRPNNRGNHQQRGHGGNGGNGGNHRHGKGGRPHGNQPSRHQGDRPQAAAANATQGQPRAIENVTFMQRPKEPHRNAGYRGQNR